MNCTNNDGCIHREQYDHRHCQVCPMAVHEGCHTEVHGTLYCDQCHLYWHHLDRDPDTCVGNSDTYI